MKIFWIPLLSLLMCQAATADHPEHKNTVLIFVSFSMPPASLSALLWDAHRIQAPVLMNGLVDHTFKATFARIHETVKRAGGGGISIDPLAFDTYHITQVPTFVVRDDGPGCVDKLSGDIPLSAALSTLRDQGDCHVSALTQTMTLLEKAGGSHDE